MYIYIHFYHHFFLCIKQYFMSRCQVEWERKGIATRLIPQFYPGSQSVTVPTEGHSMGWERSPVWTFIGLVTLKDISGLTGVIINMYCHESADTEDSPHELHETHYLSLVCLLEVNTGKLLDSVYSPDWSVHDFKLSPCVLQLIMFCGTNYLPSW